MLLYHGTKEREIEKFKIIPRTNNPPEFGDGVYLTTFFLQAKDRSCMYSKSGAVYVFDVNLETLDGICVTDSKSEENNLFYYTAYLNRIDIRDIATECLDELKGKDYIYGSVLKKIDAFKISAEQFNSGDKGLKEFIQETKTFDRFEQYCFRTAKAIDALNMGIRSIVYTRKVKGEVIIESVESRKQENEF